MTSISGVFELPLFGTFIHSLRDNQRVGLYSRDDKLYVTSHNANIRHITTQEAICFGEIPDSPTIGNRNLVYHTVTQAIPAVQVPSREKTEANYQTSEVKGRRRKVLALIRQVRNFTKALHSFNSGVRPRFRRNVNQRSIQSGAYGTRPDAYRHVGDDGSSNKSTGSRRNEFGGRRILHCGVVSAIGNLHRGGTVVGE